MTDYCAYGEALIQGSMDCPSSYNKDGPRMPSPASNTACTVQFTSFLIWIFFVFWKISKQRTSKQLTATEYFFPQEYLPEFFRRYVWPECPKTLKVNLGSNLQRLVLGTFMYHLSPYRIQIRCNWNLIGVHNAYSNTLLMSL